MDSLFQFIPFQRGVLFDERTGGAIVFLDLNCVANCLGVPHRSLRRTSRTKRLYMGLFTAYWQNVNTNGTDLKYIDPIK